MIIENGTMLVVFQVNSSFVFVLLWLCCKRKNIHKQFHLHAQQKRRIVVQKSMGKWHKTREICKKKNMPSNIKSRQ